MDNCKLIKPKKSMGAKIGRTSELGRGKNTMEKIKKVPNIGSKYPTGKGFAAGKAKKAKASY